MNTGDQCMPAEPRAAKGGFGMCLRCAKYESEHNTLRPIEGSAPTKLVGVDRHAGNAWHREVEVGHWEPQLARERQHEAAQAGIRVARHTAHLSRLQEGHAEMSALVLLQP